MLIAMNRFKIALAYTGGFEHVWRERESYFDEGPDLRSFHLLRGPETEDQALYASHAVWKSRAAFDAWTRPEDFRKAHAQASAPKGTSLAHPESESFEAVL